MALPSAETAPLAITAGIRPPRTGVFVPAFEDVSWHRRFEQAMARRVGVWGGAADLLFPLEDGLEDHPLFWRLADLLDADSYVINEFAGDDLADLDPPAYDHALGRIRDRAVDEANEATLIAEFLDQPLQRAPLTPAVHDALVRRVAPLAHGASEVAHAVREQGVAFYDPPTVRVEELEGPMGGPCVVPLTSVSDVHSLLLTTEVGRFTQRTRDQLAIVGLQIKAEDVASERDVNRVLCEPVSREHSRLPLALSEYGLQWYRRQPAPLTKPVLVTGGDVWDFVLFYALRRFTGAAWWLPPELVGTPFCLQLTRAIQRWQHAASQLLQVTSFSDPESRSEGVRALMAEGRPQLPHQLVDWDRTLPPDPNQLYVKDRASLPVSSVVYGGRTTDITTPVPVEARTRDLWKSSWMVDARVEGWTPLRHAELSTSLLDCQPSFEALQRMSRYGPTWVSPGPGRRPGMRLEDMAVRPKIAPRPLLAQLQLLLEEQGWSVEPSDKGAYALRAEQLFGGFSAMVEALGREDYAAVLGCYLRQGGGRDVPGRWLSIDKRRYLTFDDISGLVARDAPAFVERLRTSEILTLGSILKCRRCRAAAWYSADRFGSSFECTRCQLEQRADRLSWLGADEPQWTYRLDEALHQFLVHDGDLPVMAAGRLLGDSDRDVDTAYELNLRSPDGRLSELDVAISDGSSLWVGEATTSDRLKKTKKKQDARLGRLRDVAEVTGARDVVLISKGAFHESVLRTAEGLFGGPWLRLHIEEGQPMIERG